MKKIVSWLLGDGSNHLIKNRDRTKGYASPGPSFAGQWAIVDFCDETNLFLFQDGISVGSGFELGSVAAEATSPHQLQQLFEKIKETFAQVVPLHAIDPWVMQIYVQDEFKLEQALSHLKKSIPGSLHETEFTQDYLARLNDLFRKMVRQEGLFLDPKTDSPFRGRIRRIRILFYRHYHQTICSRDHAIREHTDVMAAVQSKLESPGLKLKRLTGKAYYQWWVNWFNGEPDRLLQQFPHPKENASGSFHLPASCFFSLPQSDKEGFCFDGMKHRILYVDGLREAPAIGALSREKPQINPKHRYALLDKLPEGAIYTIQVVFSNDKDLEAHLTRLEKGIIGTSLKPSEVRNDIKLARDELTSGNRLYWVTQAIFYRAQNDVELIQHEKALQQLFTEAKMPLIPSCFDTHPLNSYLNALPFNFEPHFSKRYLCVDRLIYASELAALLPVYGRNQGAKHLPCFTFFNRLGEPVFFDVLHPDFISQNSHMALFANSGGGKSVATGWMINTLMATKNARIVVFEMGNSFDRLLIHAKAKGKKTKQLLFSQQKDKSVPLNPFCDAYKALPEISNQLDEEKAIQLAKKMAMLREALALPANVEEKECNESTRSYLAELTLALRTMITEANEREEAQFTLADETLLIELLSDAILTSFHASVPQVCTEHVLKAFERRLQTETLLRKKERVQDMHDRLKSYVINQHKARFFNVPTEPLDDFDIFHIDISAIKDDKGRLALVMVSLLPRILAIVEGSQNDNRPTFLFVDEAHIQFQIDVIVSYCLLLAKVARKLGLWLVPITQNVADMQSEKATKILSLIETWILLGLNEKELADVKQFKRLTEEQEALIRDIDSAKGLYAEAVLLGSRYQGLFRVIPPRYLLALLLNEKSEKAERHLLEEQHDVLKAAELIAEKLETPRTLKQAESYFYDDE